MNTKKIVTILVVLLFPSLLYVIFATGKHHIDKAEFFGPKSPDSTYYQVPDAHFLNFTGDSVFTENLKDNILLYNFFCVACSDSSARNALLVKAITERFFDKKDIKYISINLTPSQWDSVQIAEYIRPFNIDPEQWFFVTSDSGYLANFANNGLLLGTEYDPISLPFQPGMATVVIVDKDRHIRGFLDGNQYVDQSAIIDVIKRIRLEEYQKNSKRREDQFERKRK